MASHVGMRAHVAEREGSRHIAAVGSRRRRREGTGHRRRTAGSLLVQLRTAPGRHREDKLRQKPEGSRPGMGSLSRHLHGVERCQHERCKYAPSL